MAAEKEQNGCLWIVIAVLVTTLGYGLLRIIGVPTIASFIVALGISYFLASKLMNTPKPNIFMGGLLFSVLCIGLLRMVLSFFGEALQIDTNTTFNPSEKMVYTTMIENQDTVAVYQSNRVWNDNYGKNYSTTLTIREQDYTDLYNHVAQFKGDKSTNFWGDLYDYIDRTDSPKLDLVLASFAHIQANEQLDQMQFAEMVVSCIQDIPYSFVFEAACLPAENYEYSIQKILEKCPECCIGGVAYGVQNPLSFLKTLRGDCDSRTVLIYSVLKHFGYDVAILNSDFYRHSILGINLPAAGDYKSHYGKRYILWETTARYFKAGDLPASFNNVSHWNVVLTSK